MKKKKIFIIMLTTILCLCFIATSARAGSKQRHRWEGVAIGLGAAIVGSALINHYRCCSDCGPPPAVSIYYSDYGRPRGNYNHHWRPHRHAHWRSHHLHRYGHWRSHH